MELIEDLGQFIDRRGLIPVGDWQHHLLKRLSTNEYAYASTAGEPTVDVKKMMARAVISTQLPDNVRDIVVIKGVDLDRHSKNPVVFVSHNRWSPAIALARSGDGEYRVTKEDSKDGPRIVSEAYFFQDRWESEQTFRMVEKGAIGGASVGISVAPKNVQIVRDKAGTQYAMVNASELVEWSFVIVPENKDAIVIAVEKGIGGKPLCDELRKIFEPMLPALRDAPIVRSGFDGASLLTKGDAADLLPGGNKKTKVKDDDGDDDDEETMKLGAQILTGVHALKMQLADFITEGAKMLENPKVEAKLDEILERLGEDVKDVVAFFKETYPNLPELKGLGEDDEETTPESVAEGESEEKAAAEKKAKKTASMKKKMFGALEVYFKTKASPRMSKNHRSVCKEAADFLGDCGKHTGVWTATHKAAARLHAKELSSLVSEGDDIGGAMKSKSADVTTPPAPEPTAPASDAMDMDALAAGLRSMLQQELEPIRQTMFEITGKG